MQRNGAANVSNLRLASQNCLESATHARGGVQNLYRREQKMFRRIGGRLLKNLRFLSVSTNPFVGGSAPQHQENFPHEKSGRAREIEQTP